MSHSCSAWACDSPHSDLDSHKDECGCITCHECTGHDWRDWNVYPECEYCEFEMLEYWSDELKEAA